MGFYMVLHIRLGNVHSKSYKNRYALRVVLTLKTIVTTFWATLGAFLGTLKLFDLAQFFNDALATAKALTYKIS